MKKKELKKPKFVFLVIGVIVVLALAQLAISHWLATAGGRMRQLEEKAQILTEKNRLLAEEINQMGSLSRIASEAQKLGLVKAQQVLHLTPQVPVALENKDISLGR
ncbi:hypothetical protein FJZ41_01015 [Candidatus Shapirobacteria bacterium]|nr:hypothetical protein [Candidatus Shapirobacteria bacterium]